MNEKLAILVGGGPAPGINSVIGAATIRACLSGVEVVGIQDGFKWLIEGDTSRVTPLTIARHEPHPLPRRLDPRHLAREPDQEPRAPREVPRHARPPRRRHARHDRRRRHVLQLDRSSRKASKGSLRVVHVPKTIDNDLDLPQDVYTFGFQTARHIGVEIVKNLMVDAKTTSRWYFVVAMGRKAGHLALGIGKAAGATLTLVSEEFREPRPRSRRWSTRSSAPIIKRLSHGRPDGVAVLAEGLVEHIRPSDIEGLEGVERDAHGHIRIAEVDFGNIVKEAVQEAARRDARHGDDRLEEHRLRAALRRPDPVRHGVHARPRLLRRAVRHRGRHRGAHQHPARPLRAGARSRRSWIPSRVACACAWSTSRPIATRSRAATCSASSAEDLEDRVELAHLAAAANMTPAEFKQRFGYLVENETRPSIVPMKAAKPV